MPHGSRPQYAIRTEKNVCATMRDGTKLYADVYRPDAEGRFPVILLRLPYGKHMAELFGDHEYFPARGYVVIIQDGRGRFESEGEYYALIDEAQDGYDTVEWAASLPYSNGLVGTQGQSYLGATQYQLAPDPPAPPALRVSGLGCGRRASELGVPHRRRPVPGLAGALRHFSGSQHD